jgi:hypothetical protein
MTQSRSSDVITLSSVRHASVPSRSAVLRAISINAVFDRLSSYTTCLPTVLLLMLLDIEKTIYLPRARKPAHGRITETESAHCENCIWRYTAYA